MTDKRLITSSGGIETHLRFDDADGSMALVNTGDVEGLLNRNKALQNAPEFTKGDNMRHAASIPMHIFWELEKQGITKDPVRMKRWLNDPDNRWFRTSTDQI